MKKPAKKSPKTVLVLRTVDQDRKSYGGFQWPEKGPVKCPDWDPAARCGNGLHGWLRGEGDSSVAGRPLDDAETLWQVVEVEEASIVQLGGKVKFPRGVVLYTGTRDVATKMVADAHPGAAVIYGTATAGGGGTATAGYGGTATAGDRGTATAGNYGTATAGNYGTATAGYGGTATAGYRGTATAGSYGTIVLVFWDVKAQRDRKVVGYPGEDGIEAGKAYRLDASGKLVLA